MDEDELYKAIGAIAASNFNGVMSLAMILVRRGLMDRKDVDTLHHFMSKPFQLEGSNHIEILRQQQEALDNLSMVLIERLESSGG